MNERRRNQEFLKYYDEQDMGKLPAEDVRIAKLAFNRAWEIAHKILTTEANSLPASIQEALNMGDGVYRP